MEISGATVYRNCCMRSGKVFKCALGGKESRNVLYKCISIETVI